MFLPPGTLPTPRHKHFLKVIAGILYFSCHIQFKQDNLYKIRNKHRRCIDLYLIIDMNRKEHTLKMKFGFVLYDLQVILTLHILRVDY